MTDSHAEGTASAPPVLTEQPERLDLRSHDIVKEKQLELLRLFPEIRTEGSKIDFDRLKRVLGETVDPGKERYGMNWVGKAECFKAIQSPSLGTLLPSREEGLQVGKTDDVMIEGDNLEVLKLMQKAYLGKIKLIYIDPPYNTGNDFIYPDNYSESLQTYLEYTGQADSEGKRFGTNTEADGRFHTKWLNMMYPRLYLARNLLKETGCIFISIDDVELANLRLLCDEIFGSEHFCGIVSRATGTRMGSGSSTLSSELDYILIYAKSDAVEFDGLPMDDDDLSIYDQEDEKGRYLIRSLRRTGGENRREDRPSMYYAVSAPDGTAVYPIAPAGYESRWVCGKSTYEKLLADGFIEWKKVNKEGEQQWQVYQKHYVGSALKQPSNLWNDEEGNKKATRDLNELFDGQKVFDHPKPVGVMQRIISLATEPNNNDIILDFFAGSGTTGHAVWMQNLLDQGNRQFILVQLPEKLDEEVKSQQVAIQFCEKYGLPKTVAELTKERLRRTYKKITNSSQLVLSDQHKQLGFAVYKLDQSNFRAWNAERVKDDAALSAQLDLHVDHIHKERTDDDILYELLLKSGFQLTTPFEKKAVSNKTVYSVASGALVICLDHALTLDVIHTIAEMKPERVVCLDEGFSGNDQLKTNAVQTFKTKGITSFKTV
jgi:adenine-specific DNA-methyltransferase